jgi:F-type H+-transporting ATPase subunit epsilon
LDETVISLIAPGGRGSLGILAHHAPLITTLSAGKLSITSLSGTRQTFAIGEGFLDVLKNEVTLLTRSLQPLAP